MQTVVVFAALICAAAAQTLIKSDRLGGNFAYSTAENKGYAIIGAPATTYAAYAGVSPYLSTLNGVQLTGAHNIAVARSVIAAGTPASTYKTLAGISPLHQVGVYGYPAQHGYQIAY